MKKQYHILNGDALMDQFPEEIKGELIVARECLVEGNVKGDSLEQFFNNRAQFISGFYEDYNPQDYFHDSVTEFEKILAIPEGSEINLWFEDDLFCQVNFWFVAHLIVSFLQKNKTFLIRPVLHNQFGFAGLTKSELMSIYKNRQALTELDKISSLWEMYQRDDREKLINVARTLKDTYSFIPVAVACHIERIPSEGNVGRPSQSLITIMKELNTKEFGPVFKEFCQRESIYGFGDLQVKRLFDAIINNR